MTPLTIRLDFAVRLGIKPRRASLKSNCTCKYGPLLHVGGHSSVKNGRIRNFKKAPSSAQGELSFECVFGEISRTATSENVKYRERPIKRIT